jgi:exoribonuclease-2
LEKIRHAPKTETQTAFTVDVEDADPPLAPEDASAASIIEPGSLVEVRKCVRYSFVAYAFFG